MTKYKSLCIFMFIVALLKAIEHFSPIRIFPIEVQHITRLPLVTAYCLMVVAIFLYAIVSGYQDNIARFIKIMSLAFIFLTLIIVVIIMLLDLYVNSEVFIARYLPSIPMLVVLFIVVLQGIIYHFVSHKVGTKIKILSGGIFAVVVLGVLEYITTFTYIGKYYVGYKMGMSLLGCLLALIAGYIFFKVGQDEIKK